MLQSIADNQVLLPVVEFLGTRGGTGRSRAPHVPDVVVIKRLEVLPHKLPRAEVAGLFAYPHPLFRVLVLVGEITPYFQLEWVELLHANDGDVVPVSFSSKSIHEIVVNFTAAEQNASRVLDATRIVDQLAERATRQLVSRARYTGPP